MSDRTQLGDFLKTVIHWTWGEFVKAEHDQKYSALQATVLALVRTTSDAKLNAIKLAINRVDGILETPIRFETPKIYFVYPYATSVAGLPTGDMPEEKPIVEDTEGPVDIATATLRDTVRRMADTERPIVPLILQKKKEVEDAFARKQIEPVKNQPLVKSVIAANLLHLAIEKNNFEAISEVFDQIDGKLVETIKLLGEDVMLTQYGDVAPAGAVKNSDGHFMIEQQAATKIWEEKLRKK